MARRGREYRNILSIAIAQTQTEHASSPSITVFTTQWACRNSAISETSEEASGKADCATSAGFMAKFLSTQVSPLCPARPQFAGPSDHAPRAAAGANAKV